MSPYLKHSCSKIFFNSYKNKNNNYHKRREIGHEKKLFQELESQLSQMQTDQNT